jgi:hypothetical protein
LQKCNTKREQKLTILRRFVRQKNKKQAMMYSGGTMLTSEEKFTSARPEQFADVWLEVGVKLSLCVTLIPAGYATLAAQTNGKRLAAEAEAATLKVATDGVGM